MRIKTIAVVCAVVALLSACEARGDLATRPKPNERRALDDETRPRRPRQREPQKVTNDKGGRGESNDNQPRKKEPRPVRRGPLAYVSRVIDGDTVEVEIRGVSTSVRLIGFDTPETVHPAEPVECFGKAASAYTADALQGRRVELEFDVERKDHYGRLLAYVWRGDSLFNEAILRAGYAQISTYPPNVKYEDRFLAAQRSAREHDRGLWARCNTPAESAVSSGSNSGGSGSRCDPHYAGACIPVYPPDIDCPDAPATDFVSKGNDPHGLDANGDGIACES